MNYEHLSLTETIRSKIKEPGQQELLDITIRNAKRQTTHR